MRRDRDLYVNILKDNLQPGSEKNFKIIIFQIFKAFTIKMIIFTMGLSNKIFCNLAKICFAFFPDIFVINIDVDSLLIKRGSFFTKIIQVEVNA